MNPMEFVAELRRRNVLKVALAYLVAGWFVIEVLILLFRLWGTPPGLLTGAIVFVIATFPIVLLISWKFEMTPRGLQRTENISSSHSIPYWSRRKFTGLILGLGAAATVLCLYRCFHG